MSTKGSTLLTALNMMLEQEQRKKDQDTDLALGIISNQMQINFQKEENELNRLTNILNKKLELNNQTLNDVNDSLDVEIENLETLTGQVFTLDPVNSSGNVGNITNDIVNGSMAQLKMLVDDTNAEITNNRQQLTEVKKQKKIATTIQDYFKGVGSSYDAGLDPDKWDKEDFSLEELNEILKDRYNVTINDANAFMKGAYDVNMAKLDQNILDANKLLFEAKTVENQAILSEIETENVQKYNEFTQIEKDKLVIESSYGGLVYPNVRDAQTSIANAQLAFTNYNSLVASEIPKDDFKATEREENIADAKTLYEIELYNIGADINNIYLPVDKDGVLVPTMEDGTPTIKSDEYNRNIEVGKKVLNANVSLNEGWMARLANPGAHINIIPYHNMIEELHYSLMRNDNELEDGQIDFPTHTQREIAILNWSGGMTADDVHTIYEQGEAAIDRLQELNTAGLNTQFGDDISSEVYSFDSSLFKGAVEPSGSDGEPKLDENLQHGMNIGSDIDIKNVFAKDPNYDFLGSFNKNLNLMQTNVDLGNVGNKGQNTYNYNTVIDDTNWWATEFFGTSRPIKGNSIGGTFSEFTHMLWGISNEKFSVETDHSNIKLVNEPNSYLTSKGWAVFNVDESAIRNNKPKIISDLYLSDTSYTVDFRQQDRSSGIFGAPEEYRPTVYGRNNNIGPGKMTSVDYVPTKEETLVLRDNANELIDKILQEFLENKTTREDRSGNIYEVTNSPTLQNNPIFYGVNPTGPDFVPGEKDMVFKVGEANNIVVNLQSMFDKYFDDIPVKRLAQDAIWRDLLQHEGYTREDLPSELKYLFDKPKGYYHWEPDKRMMYEEWATYTPSMKESYGGDFHQFYEDFKKSGKKPMGPVKDYDTSEIINIYEALDKV